MTEANRSEETVADIEYAAGEHCGKCQSEKTYVECYNCEDGYSDHDCGEDCCCCAEPEPNVRCDICDGDGGYFICGHCHPESLNDI
jgi:hypothetical protein